MSLKDKDEQVEDETVFKCADHFIELMDQKDHLLTCTGKLTTLRILIKWIYDMDIEKLNEL